MPWSHKNCLNRWCLRSLHQGCDSRLHNYLNQNAGLSALAHARHQGKPPLQNACIGMHCDRWLAIDGEHGTCGYLQDCRRAAAQAREYPSPAGSPGPGRRPT